MKLEDMLKLLNDAAPYSGKPDWPTDYEFVESLASMGDKIGPITVEPGYRLRNVCSNYRAIWVAMERLLRVAEAAKEVARFMEPEWRDDIDRGDADIALTQALAALESQG